MVLHDECSADVKDLKAIDRILQPHREGLPAVVIHCAMHSYRSEGWPQKTTPWFEFTGLPSTGHGPGRRSPLPSSAGRPHHCALHDWTTINEELYNNSAGKLLDTARPLARGKQTFTDPNGKRREAEFITVWTNVYKGKTRVFGTTLGHNTVTVNDPRYLDLVTRGLLWSVGKLDAAHLKPAAKTLLEK